MNLYIISEVLYDYTDGMAVIAAPSLDRCRELFAEEFGSGSLSDYDASIRDGHYKVLSVQGQDEGIVSYVYGGG